MKFLCKLRGHKWRTLWSPGVADKGGVCLVCVRCGENGWELQA